MEQLMNHRILSYKTKTGEFVFGKPGTLVDEGDFYRIGDTHVIKKYGVESVNQQEDLITILYNDGLKIELTVC